MSKTLKPIHPGEILREEYMIPLGLSSNALARALNVTAARINEIVRERRGISADTALRLARFFNTDVQSWINLQANYDVQCAEEAAGRAIARIQPHAIAKVRASV
jgi:addiction module HigA family antidote